MRTWPATADELPLAASLLGEFRDYYGRDTPTDAEFADSVALIATSGSGEYLLGTLNGDEAVGVVQLRYRWSIWTSSDDAWIEDVFVRESSRGAGLGRALMELAMARARERGCARIELDVDEANHAALTLYRELGFSAEIKAEERSLMMGRRLGA